ncbi:LAFA_0G17172g1_1 [Lachancea sp. 'fantastica']|nr:LAFA_0G17172g1_1 [Lachancea sp. 'fantastica']
MSLSNESKKLGNDAGDSKTENSEQIVTVFDLATEIEHSLQKLIEDVKSNDREFQEQFESIQKGLKSLEK